MLRTLTRNDERCSDRSPRPRSFFSGRMPSSPPSVEKKAPTASSLWFPCGGSYFLVFSVAYIRGVVSSSSMASLFKDVKVSLPVENSKRRWFIYFFRSEGPWQCERRWWLLVDLSVSSACWRCLPACLPPLSRVTQMSAGKQRHPTVGAGKDSEAVSAAPQRPLLEETLQSYKSPPTYNLTLPSY